MREIRPTRAEQVYIPPAQPQFTPRQPQFTPPPAPPYTPSPPQHRAPSQRMRKELVIAGAVIGVIALVTIIIVSVHSPSSPAYVSQLKSDGFTLERQGTLTGGAGVGYAEGDNAAGGGELVVQAKSAADARATASGMQGGGFDVTTEGDMLVIQAGSYTSIQALVTGNGW